MEQTKLSNEERPLTWDEIGSKKPKVKWSEDDRMTVVFLNSRPVEMTSKFDGRQLWLFDVLQENEDRVLLTSSTRLARALKSLGDFAGKTVLIRKSGQGMNLRYFAEIVS